MLEGDLVFWEAMQFTPGGFGALFYTMCDAVEGVVGNVSSSAIPDEGVGLEKALPNYALWFNTSFIYNRE
jgi:hypothetical protein